MDDLRELLERGTGAFAPDVEDALDGTRRRAARRARGRRMLAGAVALSLTAGVLGGLWAMWLGGDPEETPRPAVRPTVVAEIPIGPIEGRPVFGEGRLWVAAEGALHAIDPDTAEVVLTVEDATAPFALGAGSVWGTMPGDPPSLVRIDHSTGEITAVIPLSLPRGIVTGPWSPVDVAVHQDRVVVALHGVTVAIVDPATDEVVRREVWRDDGGDILEMTASGEALWMRHRQAVSGQAPRSGTLSEFPGNRILAVAPSGREAWVVLEGAARRIDLSPVQTGTAGEAPTRIVEVPPVSDAVVVDGSLWIVAGAGDGPWDLRAYDLSTGQPPDASLALGTGEAPRMAFGAGLLWITDPSGEAVIAVDPYGQVTVDPEPRLTEEPEPRTGCPPPDLVPTWFPGGISPTTPQRGLGGGMGGTQPFPNAVHYGDSPGPDGGPAPFINVLAWTADDHEVGPPHIWPPDARRFGTPVEVLGGQGFLVEIEGGWGAIFSDGDPPCNGYEVTAYGVSHADLRRFLEGLVPPLHDGRAVEPREGLVNVRPRRWETVEVLSQRLLRVRFISGIEACVGVDRVEVDEGPETVTITLFEGSVPGVNACIGLGVGKAVDAALEAPLGGREIMDGAPEED